MNRDNSYECLEGWDGGKEKLQSQEFGRTSRFLTCTENRESFKLCESCEIGNIYFSRKYFRASSEKRGEGQKERNNISVFSSYPSLISFL